ncbi:helix-turn-helix domain-containing protein [Dysgonomonas sp. 520]|uniref:helix-turn-helix domain-containing protein n=1 Tax=Dysgonomonas sp. 520 TaxID=2302931 RepID=UPI0013D0E099|nr:helix-turn-helix domain-containing protein [Dysgonomonas sp. 520]NDW10772.1 AraC family transcriptional regulator [Dysgonomonas sp. 520]
MNFENKDIDTNMMFVDLEKGKQWTARQDYCRIILVISGRLNISFSDVKEESISASKFFFLPAGYGCLINALEKSFFVSIGINDEDYLYDSCRMNELKSAEQQGVSYLPFNDVMSGYIRSLLIYKGKNIDYNFLADIKAKELICILKASYAEEQLSGFFSTYLTNNLHFSEQVRKLTKSVRNVRELADQMHYSYSGFNKKFRKVFGVSAYSWLRQRRANTVYHEIYHTDKSLKQISTDNKFATLSHFNEFCHKILGASPRQIRSKRYRKQNT